MEAKEHQRQIGKIGREVVQFIRYPRLPRRVQGTVTAASKIALQFQKRFVIRYFQIKPSEHVAKQANHKKLGKSEHDRTLS